MRDRLQSTNIFKSIDCGIESKKLLISTFEVRFLHIGNEIETRNAIDHSYYITIGDLFPITEYI